MAFDQDSTPFPLPTACSLKARITDNEKATTSVLARLQTQIDTHGQLKDRLAVASQQNPPPQERNNLKHAVRSFLLGERAGVVGGHGAHHPKAALTQEAISLEFHLKGPGYRQIEERTLAHYDDIKDLALLDILGDPEAAVFRQRSLDSLFRLRGVQREIESLPLVVRKGVRTEGIGNKNQSHLA